MKNIRFIKKQMKSITAFMLVVAMVVTSLPYVTLANNEPIQNPLEQSSFEDLISNELIPDDELFEFSGSGTIEAERLQERFSLEHTEINIFDLNNSSQRRQMYFQLLEGNYPAVELISRFEEMFGVFSATYIRENFTTIFDISINEIDEGLLNIIAPVRTWQAEQLEASLQQNFVHDMHIHMFDSIADTYDLDLFHDLSFDALVIEPKLHPPLPFDEPIHYNWDLDDVDFEFTTYFDAGFNTDIDTISFDHEIDLNNFGFDNQLASNNLSSSDLQGFVDITPSSFSGNSHVSVRLISVTNTSITVELFFNPIHFNANNTLRILDPTVLNPPFAGVWVQVARPLPSNTSRFTISGLVPGTVYRLNATTWNSSAGEWVSTELAVRTSGARTPSLSITNITQTGFTVNAIFPSERDHGNQLVLWNGVAWVNVASTSHHLSSGSFTVRNLTPGIRYAVNLMHFNRLSGTQAPHIVSTAQTTLPPESIVTFTRSNMEFRFDRFFADTFAPGLLNRFLDSANNAYTLQHNLVGGALPFNGNRMRFETSRRLPWYAEGRAGQPITWSVWNEGFHIATDQLLMMNRHNVHMTETPIHEIAHNFQRSRWLFEAEALAIFQTYYHFAMTGESMVVSNHDMVFTGGSGFMRYMRSFAIRVLGHINYDAAMRQGVYSPYSLAWTLANIQTRIGWEPFRQTFRAFDSMPQSQVPPSNLGKLNLFLSMLQDFSGQNVFNMLSAQERLIYQAHFGSTIAYIDTRPMVPRELRWVRYYDWQLDKNFYVSRSRVQSFAGHSNVFIGIEIEPGLNVGDLYISQTGRNWTYLSTVTFVNPRDINNHSSLHETHNMAINASVPSGDNFVLPRDDGPGRAGNPTEVTEPRTVEELRDFHWQQWLEEFQPINGTRVYHLRTEYGQDFHLTYADAERIFGAEFASRMMTAAAAGMIPQGMQGFEVNDFGNFAGNDLTTSVNNMTEYESIFASAEMLDLIPDVFMQASSALMPVSFVFFGVVFFIISVAIVAMPFVVSPNANFILPGQMNNFWDTPGMLNFLALVQSAFIFPSQSLTRVWDTPLLPPVAIPQIRDIARSFPVGKCVEAADAIEAEMIRQGRRDFERISIQFPRSYVISYLYSGEVAGFPNLGNISENGFHTGVLIGGPGGLVYCNIHSNGLPLATWLNDFVMGYPGMGVVTPSIYQHLKTRHTI